MKKRVERLRGMHDLLPEAYQQQRRVIDRLGSFLNKAGYVHVDTPVLERSDLFHASFGQELWHNLYSFRLHQRDLCLRPEYTASICRLYLDHYQQHPLPQRFQYAGPVFRYKAPGRSRYRQQTQLGVELFGGQEAAADAEILQLACDMLRELGIKQYRLEVGHIGVASGFINRLQLDDQAAHLLLSLMEKISRSEDGEQVAQKRLEALYPPDPSIEKVASIAGEAAGGATSDIQMRYITSLLSGISISFGNDTARDEVIERFLWKMGRNEQRRQILYALEFLRELHAVSGPPPAVFERLQDLIDRYGLDPAPLAELQQLISIVKQCGVSDEQIILNLSLGRGVSYYTGLVFEIHAQESDGFDTQLGGGGRYDRFIHAIGGSRDVNACGFVFWVERLLSLLTEENQATVETTQALVIPVSSQEFPYALSVARAAREQGLAVEVDVTGHGLSSGLRLAVRKQKRMAFIVGDAEQQQGVVTVRDLVSGKEQKVSIEELGELVLEEELV